MTYLAQLIDVVRSRPTSSRAAAPPAPAALPLTIIQAHSGWQALDLKELWGYRELLYFLTWRDVKVRYKQTALGAAWAVLQPLMTMIVFSLFFGRLAQRAVGQPPLPDLRVRRAAALDLLRQRDRRRRPERRGQRAA